MKDNVFTMRSTPYKFGVGVTEEIGDDLLALGLKRVLIVTDAGVLATGLPERVLRIVQSKGIETGMYADVKVEPTDNSVKHAIEFANTGAQPIGLAGRNPTNRFWSSYPPTAEPMSSRRLFLLDFLKERVPFLAGGTAPKPS